MDMDHMKPTTSASRRLSPGQAVLLPWAFIAGLAGLGLLVRLGGTARAAFVSQSMLGAAGLLLVWTAALYVTARRSGRTLSLQVVLFKGHWVQALTQVALYSYWGWYVPDIRVYWPLLLAQLLFAYGFHILLIWSRRDHYGLGFGPVPITLSFNLFILFRPEWFVWQFGIVALAFAAKEFIRWEKDGRSAHIFNPSSFALFVFSLALMLTGTTDTTLGVEIASALFNAPNMYLVLFLVSLPVQLLFGVTTMTIAAVVTTYVFGLLYLGATGTYLFFDAYIPIAVFVGMHLLITDPSTAPRTESGRIVFGVLYGLGTMAAFGILRMADLPAFYDKLLPVPILNLLVQVIDRAAVSEAFKSVHFPSLGQKLSAARRRVALVGIWAGVFVAISAAGGLDDEHPGQWAPFWQEACQDGSDRACEHLAVLQQNLCLAGSGWACNELGILLAALGFDPSEIRGAIRRGCTLEFPTACENLGRMATRPETLASARPLPGDLPIILRGSKGPIPEQDPNDLYALACERGWLSTCGMRVEP